jgi:hypothetical protein
MNRLLVVVIFFTLSVRAEGACFTIAKETRLALLDLSPRGLLMAAQSPSQQT